MVKVKTLLAAACGLALLAGIAAAQNEIKAGKKGTLSTLSRDGMKPVTVRVSDIDGVSSFVLRGDWVDVVLTRDANSRAADVVIQNIKVLDVERTDKPTVAISVTLEVDTVSAQKLALASSAGKLSLMLRKAGD
jgi:pilus assembly protein CpaB